MNYRHVYHAGNFADVLKHITLIAVLQHFRKKPKPFAVIDTHAGRGLYDLRSEEAIRTGEAAEGIERLRGYETHSALIQTYLTLVRSFGGTKYPGSPLIAARLLRQEDRLLAVERHLEELAALRENLGAFGQARAIEGDGYALLPRQIPPRERRGLVLMDPPFEMPGEFERLGHAIADAYKRFATGTFLVWYPVKTASGADALVGEFLTAGVTDLLRLTCDVGRKVGAPEQLSAAGLLVINPPYKLDAQIRDASDELLPLLARGPAAHAAVEWLAGPN